MDSHELAKNMKESEGLIFKASALSMATQDLDKHEITKKNTENDHDNDQIDFTLEMLEQLSSKDKKLFLK